MESRKYPWWKHYIDFEETDLVAEMRRRDNGDSIALFYMWLISFTANTNGILSYEFGKAVKPCTLEYLARKAGRPPEIVKATLEILEEAQVLETEEINGETFQRLANIEDFRGKAESTRPEAIRQRRKYERDKNTREESSRQPHATREEPSRIIEGEEEEEEDIRDREKRKSKEKTPTRAHKFQKPTLEELKAYIKEKGYTFNAERFIAYYESNGWHVGKSPMKSWKAACVNWQSREPKAGLTNSDRERQYEEAAKKGGW